MVTANNVRSERSRPWRCWSVYISMTVGPNPVQGINTPSQAAYGSERDKRSERRLPLFYSAKASAPGSYAD
jgi:hypothetical protein